jgi:predicted nucleotidyltransferase
MRWGPGHRRRARGPIGVRVTSSELLSEGMSAVPSDRSRLSSMPPELTRQRQAISTLLEFCEESSLVTSLSVGCSIGRNAADALSDIDAAIGVRAPRGAAGAEQVREVESSTVELLPRLGRCVDVLRQETASDDFFILRVFAQFEDRLQLDLAVVAEAEVRRGEAAPDFVALYWSGDRPASTSFPSAREVSSTQVQDWAFLGWRALLDANKYLQRGSLWEAHHRLHEARERIWMLWATGHGATYPWHGLSQVLDHDPDLLPPGIEATVAGLDSDDLRRAVVATAGVLDHASTVAARKCGTHLHTGIAEYTRRTVTPG